MRLAKISLYCILKNYTRKMKLLFMVSADFGSILIPENNEKQNSDESYIGISNSYWLQFCL